MKKLVLVLIASSVMLFASVGEMLAVKGDVKVLRDSKEIVAKTGFKLEEKDVVQTASRSKAQLMFNDETVIRIGKETTFKVEEYKFDGTANSKAKFKVQKGFFKAISGKIGKVARNNFKLKTKTATCGIRGTHFMGLIGEDSEKIACTKGAITVEAQGELIDVLAGEITSFKSGLVPATPRKFKTGDLKGLEGGFKVNAELSKKIQSVKLGKDMKISQEQLDEVLAEISQIKDNDLKVAALDELESSLNLQYDTILSEGQSIDVTDSFNAGNTDIKWGFYSANGEKLNFDELTKLSANELSNALVLDEYNNIEIWRQEQVSATAPETIASKMGLNPETVSVFDSWDGRAESKKVATYEGKYLGSVVYADGHQIVDTKDNSVKFTVDFGNRFLFGNMNFNAKRPDGTTQNWNVDMASIGSYTVNPTSFWVDNNGFWAKGNFLGGDTFFNRFFGDDAEQISAYFQGLMNDDVEGEYRDEFDEIVYGAFVANRTNEITLSKQELGNDEYFSYGLWANDDLKVADVIKMGAWISPKEAITSEDIINEYIQKGAMATYNGDVFGTVHYPVDGKNSDVMQNGNIALNVDFAKASVDGKIGFDAGADKWDVNIHDGLVGADGFKFGQFDGAVNSAEAVDFVEGNGKFYGEQADRVGGGFQMGTVEGKFAIGAFKGAK